MKVRWTAELTTGVEDIDAQHRELIARMDQFLEACRQGLGKARTTQMLDFLEDYAVTHFDTEELLMARARFPRAAAHKAQHATFRKNVARIRGEFERDGAGVHVVVVVNRTVIDWMLNHIRTTDKDLGEFLCAKPVGA